MGLFCENLVTRLLILTPCPCSRPTTASKGGDSQPTRYEPPFSSHSLVNFGFHISIIYSLYSYMLYFNDLFKFTKQIFYIALSILDTRWHN